MKDAQRRIAEWISQFEEGYWPPLANLARLMEEVGELARLVNHQFGTKPKKPDESQQEMAEELADVLFVILCMANEQEIDLDEAFDSVMEKYHLRGRGALGSEGGVTPTCGFSAIGLSTILIVGVERFLRAQSCLPLPE